MTHSHASLRDALAFFTRLPVGKTDTFQGAAAWLPVIGIIVGGLAGLALWLLAAIVPPSICGLLGCLIWTAITGGLHLDGVADCGDGLLVETTPERRLDIMKDSRLGTFGGIALFGTLGMKAVVLAEVALRHDLIVIVTCCALAGMLARSAVFIAMRMPSARPGGLGDALREQVTSTQARLGIAVSVIASLLLGVSGLAALLAVGLVTSLLMTAAHQRLGGMTGDVFGCLVETAEWAALLAICTAQGLS